MEREDTNLMATWLRALLTESSVVGFCKSCKNALVTLALVPSGQKVWAHGGDD